MGETTKVVSQQEALRKYQNIKHNGDGTCTVRVRYKADGTEDPSCWNMKYRESMKETTTSTTTTSSSSKPHKKGYWAWWKRNLGAFMIVGWIPALILWIPILVLKLLWIIIKTLLKLVGIAFLLKLFGIDISGNNS